MPKIGQMMMDFKFLTCFGLILSLFGVILSWFEMVSNWYEIDVQEDVNDDGHCWDMIKLAKRSKLVDWENGTN